MDGCSAMDVEYLVEEEEGGEDPFLKFIDYARSELLTEDQEDCDSNENKYGRTDPGWSWIVSRVLKTCISYSSGVTAAILLSELFQAWNEQRRISSLQKRPDRIIQLRKNHRRKKFSNTITIDSICEKNFLSLSSVLEAVILDAYVLPGTNIYMLTLGDYWSSNVIDLYLHRRYYDLADPHTGILKKGREVFLTGCCVRTGKEGSGYTRLLPTEYLVIVLDEDQDDDAMLLGAQFCSDSFSSVSLDAVKQGTSYSLYARIESIGSLEVLGSLGNLQRKQITLVDGDGVTLKFLLWGEQILLANLFSVGSMLALERPYISSCIESGIESSPGLCLEYGSATQLYLVPCIQREEQVCITLTPNNHQSSRSLNQFNPSQFPKLSQVSLPCDSLGTVDFSNFPVRSYIASLHDKMTGVSLYGVVTDMVKENTNAEVIFSLRIEDTSGVIWAKLHFSRYWSVGRLSPGHMIFIAGLTCSVSKQNCLEVSWFENDIRSTFINLSCLPALLSSYCLHRLSRLSDISTQSSYTQICRIWLDPLEHYQVDTIFSHSLCGRYVNKKPDGSVKCSFCQIDCGADVVRTFNLKITIADESMKALAWCTGQTAMELLQISPDEFYELPEDEQVMYPCSLENEKFIVALVNCESAGRGLSEQLFAYGEAVSWEISRACKHE